MSAGGLSSRAIIGSFYERLQLGAAPYFDQLAMRFDSDQPSEEYKWLGQVPQMREWVGGRQAKGLRENGFTIKNKKFEATLEVSLDDLRRDKTGQVMVRINELATRAASHPLSLLSTLLQNGASNLCYDGQYFFDTDHQEGNSGQQSNKISVTLSTLPVGVDYHGSTTAPSAEEMGAVIRKGITTIVGFKDDQGEPINETASNFVVITPVSLYDAALTAVTSPTLRNGVKNPLAAGGFSVNVYANPRLTWTDKVAVFTTDGDTKPFIHQVEKPITIKARAEGSEYEFEHDAHQYGIDGIHNVGYGMWQKACLLTMA